MGNNLQPSSEYKYTTVNDIPEGVSPPGITELKDKINDIALIYIQKYDPVDLKTCQDCLKTRSSARQNIEHEAKSIVTTLSSYSVNDPQYSEKTWQFKMEGMPEVWISSTKNSDNTISYWFQYPILPFHVQAAFLYCMGIPITPKNMVEITERFPALYKQLLAITKNQVVKCEQIEPLYVELAVKSLLKRGYTPMEKKMNISTE